MICVFPSTIQRLIMDTSDSTVYRAVHSLLAFSLPRAGTVLSDNFAVSQAGRSFARRRRRAA